MSQNKIIKKNLDEYLKREKNKTWDESKEYLFKYIKDNNGKIPPKKQFCWYSEQKKKIDSKESDIYIKLSENEVLKKDLDEFILKFRKNK